MIILKLAGYVVFIPLIWQGGNLFCRAIIAASGATEANGAASAANVRAGRFIGLLERGLIVVGVIARSWEVIAAVVALKTVARYKELDEQIKAEYFLVGSLASIFWAVLMAGALALYDQSFGFRLIEMLSATGR